jgi:hypothetical protein
MPDDDYSEPKPISAPARIIGARRAGERGIKVFGNKATMVCNLGSIGARPIIVDTHVTERAESGKAAYLKMAARLHWKDAEKAWAE